ncbi:protein transport protein Sec31A isoform X2 [Hyalella azteca]|uniref:Protein transport protein Sec31A isoform X2 n=1 Tax=Hyalella azteca TaxID=294128 RepID=A0A979FYA5_HYAAZ|nr:protein transport protein Sec31A isoform X2 [Hyalella azteca]
MKVKEVAITASIAWSPATLQSPRLACATAAKHADPTSKNALVQVYSLNLGEENLSMKLDGSISAVTKFNDVVWGVGGQQVAGGAGVVACAGDNGGIYLYNGKQLMSGSSASLIKVMEGKHAGPVYALDFNVHQPNLLASGSQDCEVFIWDINDPAVPMSPGTKATLASDVSSVAWNRQVEHILACAYAGRCVVFDLRKSTSIVQISDAVSRMKASTVCWHPSVATQMVIASEDDLTPVCQVWDLRFASAPLKQFDGHQRGVQKLDWCMQDHDIICSAAKDNRMLCWSASTAELLCEVPSYNQWSFDVAWCHRDPALVASATVDGTVSVFSLLGGGYPPARDVKFSAIADSFPGMEMPSEAPVSVQPQTVYLARPPAFFPSKSGCSFGFGGQLLSWNAGSGVVTISQVVTEPDLVQRGNDLLAALGGAGVHQFCAEKLADLTDDHERELWEFISAGLAGEAAAVQYLSLLGYPAPLALNEDPSSALSAQMGALNTAEGSTGSLDPSEQFEMIASAQSSDKTPEPELLDPDSPGPEGRHVVVSPDGAGGAIRRAIITGQLDEAVDLCLQDSKYTLALILSQHASPELYQKTRDRVLCLESDSDALCGVTAAVVKTDLDAVVAQCSLDNWKEVVVTVINHAPAELRPQLLQRLGSRLEFSNELQNALLCYLVAGALDNFVQCWVKTKPVGSALSTQHLQDLVEVVLVVQQSGAALSTDGDAGAAVGQFLAQYASLLATQGALQTALCYLASSASLDSQAELVALRTRLERALGYSDAGNSHSSASRTRTTSTSSLQPTYRRASAPSAAFQASYELSSGPLVPPQFTPSVQARQASAFNAPPPTAAPAAPPAISSGQPSAFYQPAQQPQTFAPPPPATGGHQYGGYQAHPPPPAAAALPPPAPPAASVTAPGGLRRPGAGARYVSTAVNSTPAYQNNPAAFQPTPAFQPPSAAAPFQPVPSQPFQPVTSQPFQPIPTSSSFLDPNPSYPSSLVPAPPPHAAGDPIPYGVDAAAQPTEPPKPPAAYNPTVPRGWNDPPPMSASRREGGSLLTLPPGVAEHSGARRLHNLKAKQQQQQPPPQSSPAPSMMVPAQATPPPPATGFQGFQGFAPQGPPSGFGAPPPSSSQGMNAQQSTSPLLPPVAPLPLPAEAQGIYNVLNGLYTRGLAAAPNMMIRQTYDSVGPKLEILYEKLRSRQVGATTMQGLHSLCSCVEAGDYHQALQAHSQTVSAGNFAEMSPFMPAVKKLLTTSMQCQIFLN